MNKTFTALSAILLCAGLAIPAVALAGKKERLPAAVTQYHMLYGKWEGAAQRVGEDGMLTAFDVRMECDKVADGWAMACNVEGESVGEGEKTSYSEAHLIGVDPVSGAGHWYSIASGGDVHEHLAEWTNSSTLFSRHTWDTPDGAAEETVTYSFGGKKTLSFRRVITIAGKRVYEMTGTMER